LSGARAASRCGIAALGVPSVATALPQIRADRREQSGEESFEIGQPDPPHLGQTVVAHLNSQVTGGQAARDLIG
jgi:hypothetical protein